MSTASEVFLILTTNYIHVYAIVIQYISYLGKRGETGIFPTHNTPSPHFRWVVKIMGKANGES